MYSRRQSAVIQEEPRQTDFPSLPRSLCDAVDAAAPDAILFAISLPNLSAGRFKRLAAGLAEASETPAALVRLESAPQSLGEALDALKSEGRRNILVQPLGLPFPESLRAWLPGALGHWLDSQEDADSLSVRIGRELVDIAPLLETAAQAALDHADDAVEASRENTRLGKPGWERPPAFEHHLIVCTGPRCQYRHAASLVSVLKDETARQGVAKRCLTTRTGCMFPCNQGPMVAVYPKGEWYRLTNPEEVARFVETVLVEGRTEPELLFHKTVPQPGEAAPSADHQTADA